VSEGLIGTLAIFGMATVIVGLAAYVTGLACRDVCDGGKPHDFGPWSDPIVARHIELHPGVQTRTCKTCGAAVRRAVRDV